MAAASIHGVTTVLSNQSFIKTQAFEVELRNDDSVDVYQPTVANKKDCCIQECQPTINTGREQSQLHISRLRTRGFRRLLSSLLWLTTSTTMWLTYRISIRWGVIVTSPAAGRQVRVPPLHRSPKRNTPRKKCLTMTRWTMLCFDQG